MNSQSTLWSGLPLSNGIATLVCYAGIFGDVIGVAELASRLGVSGEKRFYAALDELSFHGRIIVADGFVGLPDLKDKILIKAAKIATAHDLINSRLDTLRELGRDPLIRFVGISGSLAADNPTRDPNNYLDIDIFLITRSQCLWRYNLWRGIRRNISRTPQEPELCINYIMDESDLLIANRNLYTATEIRNLIPVSGLDAYRHFLQVNNWVDYYYPGVSCASSPAPAPRPGSLRNTFCFLLFAILKCIQRLSLAPLRQISFKASPHIGSGLNLFTQPNGGYQALVQGKFKSLAATWFPELLEDDLIERLFPDDLSAEIRRGDIDVASIVAEGGLEINYSKYGWRQILSKSG